MPWNRIPISVLALASLACTDSLTDPGAPAVAAPPPLADEVEFASTLDLLFAIENGNFAERAGLEQELAALREPPPPVQIEFVSGTAVPAEQQAALRELARVIQADPRLRVDLIGCSDPSGPAALNRRISQQRAESVAEALRGLGVPAERIGEVAGRGEDCPVQERKVNAVPALRAEADGEAA